MKSKKMKIEFTQYDCNKDVVTRFLRDVECHEAKVKITATRMVEDGWDAGKETPLKAEITLPVIRNEEDCHGRLMNDMFIMDFETCLNAHGIKKATLGGQVIAELSC